MKQKLTMILAALFLCVGAALAQVEVRGTVVSSEDNQPIVGATVKVLGETKGVITDLDGRFNISVPKESSVLEFSYVGMETRTMKASRQAMRVVLTPDNAVLDEIMVVAYGTQKKSAFTGSASVVKSETLEKVQATNAVDALKGKASGVQINTATGQPGSTPTINIRGVNSINATSAPLIVVDGAPYSGSLNDINPHDVESMTVLKDAASTALYGARGGDGVILITTKSAKKGKDATITFDAKWGANQKATPEYEIISNPAAHYEMWYTGLKNMRLYAGASELDAHNFANQYLINSNTYGLMYNVYDVPKGQQMIGTNGKLNPNATLGNVVTGADGNKYYLTPDNWIDETYHNSTRQEYTLTASAANERSSFYASASYLSNEGITYASNYERLSGRLKADYLVKPWMKIGGNMAYGHYNMDSLGEDGSANSSGNAFAFGTIAPIYPMYVRDANGNIVMHEATGMALYDYGQGTTYVGITRPYLSQANPVSDNRLQIGNDEGNTFNGTGLAEIYLPYDFTLYSINTVNLNERRSTSTVNRYFGQYASMNGQNTVKHLRSYSYNFQQRLNWHHLFGKHDVEAMVGHEFYRAKDYDLYAYKSQTFSDTNPELASAVVMGSGNSSSSDYDTESWLGRAMYNYAEKYYVQASMVRQASSRFHPDHMWGTFWSASAAWNMKKESWFNADWVDELKIKVSYGENGNDKIGSYRYINYSSIVNSDDKIALVPSDLGNETITWEKNSKFNAGFDFSFLNGRIYGVVEYYNNRTKDMLSRVTLPASFGYTGYYDNIGNVINRGLELEVFGDVVRTKDLQWTVYANVTTNHNEVTKLSEERKSMLVDGIRGYSSGSYYYGEGVSMFTRFGRKYAGVCQQSDIDASQAEGGDGLLKQADLGKALYYINIPMKTADGDPVWEDPENERWPKTDHVAKTINYSEASDYLLGDCLADLYGGFGTSFAWKGFDASVDFQYQIGGKVYDSTYASLMGLSRGYAIHVDMLNAWTPENTGSDIPRAAFNDSYMASNSDRFLVDASYLTLSNITIGYTLPKALVQKIGMQGIRVYGVADNIWTWSKRQGLDPRQSISGSNTASYYKPIRTISGGITLTF